MREPDDDTPLPHGFMDELRRLDRLQETEPKPETKDE